MLNGCAMKIIRLGVRYCGGCREAYDRPELVRSILEGLRGKGLDVSPDYDAEAPVGILVCGCQAQCLLREAQTPSSWHYLAPDGHIDNTPLPLESIIALLHNELADPPDSR